MVQIRDNESLVPSDLKLDLQAFVHFKGVYNARVDTLCLSLTPKRPGVSLDVGGHYWIRFDPETHEVIGVEVEDFERVFLARYPELALSWREVKPAIVKRRKAKDDGPVGDYLRLLYKWLNDALQNHPQQLDMMLA